MRIGIHPQRPAQTPDLTAAPPRERGAAAAAAVTVAIVVTAAWLLTACSATVSSGSQPSPASATSRAGGTGHVTVPVHSSPTWLLTRSALSQLLADPSVRAELRAAQVYEILQPGQQPLTGFAAKPVVTFASAAALEDAVNGGQIPAGTYGVLYDPEAWSFTPAAEQRDPVLAATNAAAAAHGHGLRLIVTPALNLTTVLQPGSTQPRWQQFLDLNLAGNLARVADVIELQAQSLERDPGTYAGFVKAAAAQVGAANPAVTVLAGLSTNPPGAPVSSQHLTAAIQATRSVVAGYWLNIPGQGPRCPTCNAPRADIAIQTLQALR
jgi:hypothetical protein